VASLLKRGVAVSLCTGRMYSGTRTIAEALGLQAPVACVDGCHVVRAQTHEELLRLSIQMDAKSALHGLLCKTNLPVFAFSRDIIVHDGRGSPYMDYLRVWSTQTKRVRDMFEPSAWESLDELTSLVVVGSQTETEGLVQGVNAACQHQLQVAHFPLLRAPMARRWVVLIRRAGVDKGTAVTWLADHFKVDLSEVVVVGDWVNDVPMFAVAGRSFVMGNAPPEVKAAAQCELSATVQTGGAIEEVAERCGLL
jgi:hydroxymethylpyrimidine pyrophosphatase-like HAD family hydrolase